MDQEELNEVLELHKRWLFGEQGGVRATLNNVCLDGLDLSGADLHKKVAQAVGEFGYHLDMGVWHADCGTAHCRAGWAIVLAGEAGKVLEDKTCPSTAGALIYAKSTGMVPDFYADKIEALMDIERCAEQEK